MAKSRKNRSSVVKSLSKTANKALPVVDESLQTVGTTAKDVAKASFPIVEKGVSVVYDTMATGFNLGVKGAKGVAKGMTKSKRSRRHRKGGRRTRRHHRRH